MNPAEVRPVAPAVRPSFLKPTELKRLTVPTILLAAIIVAGFLAPGTWSYIAIGIGVQGLFSLSAGMLFGRVGLLSLCPATFGGLSAWVVAWLTVHQRLPFLIMVAAGVIAAIPAGLLVGGLALRLRGVNLAVVTLTFAAAIVAIFSRYKFPGSQDSVIRPIRPMGFQSDRAYFLLSMAVFVCTGLALEWYGRRRGGQAWRAVRYSERATSAAGLSVPQVKLTAFVISAMIGGVAGGMLYGQLKGSISEIGFLPVASLVIVAAAVMVGAQSLSGAVLAGVLTVIVPELFRRWGVAGEYPQMLFGVGAVHALSQGGGGISATFPWRLPRRSSKTPPVAQRVIPAVAADPNASPVLELRGLTVQYGALTALNRVDLVVPSGTVVGIIGPNGAGKSTLIDAVTGFVADYSGEIRLGDRSIDRFTATARAKAGLRRTFQQGRAIPELTVGQYINLFVPSPLPDDELQELLGFFELPPDDEPIQFIDVGTRRVLEVAACVAPRPLVAFLDEPAAGLGQDHSLALAQRIREIPARFGSSVVLIEHDVELVAAVSTQITVLDFGIVIARGAPQAVLADKTVAAAYLGEDIEIEPVLMEGSP